MIETALVLKLADVIAERFRAIVLLCGFAGLRSEEFLGLRRSDVDLVHTRIRVAFTARRSRVSTG